MNTDHIDSLLEKYFDGLTSLEEEDRLAKYFLGPVAPQHEAYRQFFAVVTSGNIDHALSDDDSAPVESASVGNRSVLRSLAVLVAVAASVLLLFVLRPRTDALSPVQTAPITPAAPSSPLALTATDPQPQTIVAAPAELVSTAVVPKAETRPAVVASSSRTAEAAAADSVGEGQLPVPSAPAELPTVGGVYLAPTIDLAYSSTDVQQQATQRDCDYELIYICERYADRAGHLLYYYLDRNSQLLLVLDEPRPLCY